MSSQLASALKSLPQLSYLKFEQCFHDYKIYNIPEHFFMALKLRRRPIRNMKLLNCYIGEGNLFNFIGFANRGYISEQLTLDVAGFYPQR